VAGLNRVSRSSMKLSTCSRRIDPTAELRVARAFEQIELAELVLELDEVLLVGPILHSATLYARAVRQ
jgi:hypothetical protein